MKKFFYTVISLGIVAGLWSCNNDDPDFQVIPVNAYGVQMEGSTFMPVVSFQARYGNSELNPVASGVTKDSFMPVSGTSYYTNLYEVTERFYSLDEMQGTYVFKGVTKEGEEAVTTTLLKFEDYIGDFDYDRDSFVFENSRLKVTFNSAPTNATHYCFYVRPFIDGELVQSWIFNDIYDSNNTVDSSYGEQTVDVPLTSSSIEYEQIMVYPAAVIAKSSTSLLVRIGEGKILKKGASSFESDAAAE